MGAGVGEAGVHVVEAEHLGQTVDVASEEPRVEQFGSFAGDEPVDHELDGMHSKFLSAHGN